MQCQEREVELNKEDGKSIWNQIKKQFPVFALFKSDRASTDQDSEAQDPMKTAIKEAIRAQEDILNGITEQVKEEVQKIADLTIEKIREMNPELARKLSPRVVTKDWHSLFSVKLAGDEDIPINKRGSGTRRLILLNFFRAKAETESGEKSTGVVYAIEEPETSQHPTNQLMLFKAFEELAEQIDCQVFLTTHTPSLARRFNREYLRFVSQKNGKSIIRAGNDDDIIREIIDSLGMLRNHNVKVFFGVEGRHDVNFLCCVSKMLHESGEDDIPDLANAEQDGKLIFIPTGGSNVDLWLTRLANLDIPEFYLMDRDNDPSKPPHYQDKEDRYNQRHNCTAWHTNKRELENYIHKDVIKKEYPNYLGEGDDFEDVPKLFAQAVHESSESDRSWDEVCADSKKLAKKISSAKKRLNKEFVSKMTPQLLTDVDSKDEVRTWLRAIGECLVDS